jgi:hypothetical protein
MYCNRFLSGFVVTVILRAFSIFRANRRMTGNLCCGFDSGDMRYGQNCDVVMFLTPSSRIAFRKFSSFNSTNCRCLSCRSPTVVLRFDSPFCFVVVAFVWRVGSLDFGFDLEFEPLTCRSPFFSFSVTTSISVGFGFSTILSPPFC